MKAPKRELPEQWAEKVWLTLEVLMLRSRLSRRNFEVDTMDKVVSKVRSIPTFKAYRKAVRRTSQRRDQKPCPYAVASFCAPPSRPILDHSLYVRYLLSQWQRETPPHTEPE